MKMIKRKLKSNLTRFVICFALFLGFNAIDKKQTYSESIYLDKNINEATYNELTAIDGIGHKTATEIITNQPLHNDEEMIELKYIDDKRLARIKSAGYSIK